MQRSPSRSQLRLFAALLLLMAGYIALRLARSGHPVGAGIVLAGLVPLCGIGITAPTKIRWLYGAWMGAVFPVAWLVSTLMLLAIYLLIVTPIGWVLRWRGHDPLALRSSTQLMSYWKPRPDPPAGDRYFREF